TASTNVSTGSANIGVATISQDTACAYIASQSSDIKWNMALLSMRADRFWKKTGKKISIQGTDVAGFDKSKVECFNCHKMSHFARKCRAPRSKDRGRRDNYRQGSKVEEQAPKALMEIDGVGWDWSYMANDEENHALIADEETPTEFALMAKTSAESEGSSQNNIDDKGYWDRGCSRHITGNISYLSDYEPFDGGYVSFGQGGCKITGKGTIKTECIMLGRDFKLLDDANVLLRTPRCDNRGEFRNKEMDDFCSHKGIKKEFSNARTPQQNGVAERRNRTLKEAARTMLADAKLPVTFWAEAVNTACYVQNRVLVNKSHNKTPYELFNGKFEAKGDESYFIGYFMSSKAFRVFNKKTKRVEENLHVEFLENKAIEKGVGPNWLFDIDSLTKSMKFMPVVAGTNSTNLSGIKDAASQEVKKDVSSLRYIALPNWVHDALLESSSSKPQDDCSTDVPKSSRNSNLTATSTNPLADQIETLTVETPIPTISSPVPTACFTDSQEPLIYQMDVKSAFLYGTIDEEVEFKALMHEKFQMSAMGELNFFLDSDYGGATQDCKSTTGGCQFLGKRLISWQCKKQTIVATSTTEAEYVAAASCCGQVLWIQNQLLDYRLSMPCEAVSREISSSILRL
nr:hypothetical protein [Tanacetum cinerariifolium]